jgi:hypothetical protein
MEKRGKRGKRKLPYIVYEKPILHGFKETQKKKKMLTLLAVERKRKMLILLAFVSMFVRKCLLQRQPA